MKAFTIYRQSILKQVLLGTVAIVVVSSICYSLQNVIGYHVTALLLLLTVSLAAISLDIIPVLFIAALSAATWDFFFIPPHFTFHVGSEEDSVLLLTYFIIALLNAVFTYRIRKMERKSMEKEERAHTIKLYNTMLNSLSHELRTPIATIIAATDNLQHQGANLTALNKVELTAEIATAAFRLNRQVDNLLNMSRLESGIIEPKKDWCDINELIYEMVKRVEATGARQKMNISIDPGIPLFKTDKGMIEQIIGNLISNAVIYTNSTDTIFVSAACHADILEVTIEDSGKGFPEEEIALVFDKFYRLKNSRTGGTGLGLSIAKGFTEALGGDITLSNRRDGGASFHINIPAETSYINNLKNE